LARTTANLEEKNSNPGGILTLVIQRIDSHFTSCLGPDLVMGPEEITENKIQLENQTGMPSLRFWMAEIL